VLNDLSEQVRECLQHAEECARKAAQQHDRQLRQDYLDLQRKWLSLAQSFQTSERLVDFISEARRKSEAR